jgi:hypothetical protein
MVAVLIRRLSNQPADHGGRNTCSPKRQVRPDTKVARAIRPPTFSKKPDLLKNTPESGVQASVVLLMLLPVNEGAHFGVYVKLNI